MRMWAWLHHGLIVPLSLCTRRAGSYHIGMLGMKASTASRAVAATDGKPKNLHNRRHSLCHCEKTQQHLNDMLRLADVSSVCSHSICLLDCSQSRTGGYAAALYSGSLTSPCRRLLHLNLSLLAIAGPPCSVHGTYCKAGIKRGQFFLQDRMVLIAGEDGSYNRGRWVVLCSDKHWECLASHIWQHVEASSTGQGDRAHLEAYLDHT